MFAENADKILKELKPEDVVLDIGGWAQPFRRANYVMDAMPYETRGFYAKLKMPPSTGGNKEFFSKESWIQRDICDRVAYPFADKSVDFVICSHTLEDVRDPLWVCSEMQRIAKRGYLEIPSRVFETCEDLKTSLAGSAHHRWLVEIEDNRVCFEMKYHLIHKRQFHFPRYTRYLLKPSERIQYLFWENAFEYRETPMPLSDYEIERSLETFLRTHALKPSFSRRMLAQFKTLGHRLIPESLLRRITHG